MCVQVAPQAGSEQTASSSVTAVTGGCVTLCLVTVPVALAGQDLAVTQVREHSYSGTGESRATVGLEHEFVFIQMSALVLLL